MGQMKETLPYAPHSDTSREAAKRMEKAAPSYEQQVLDYIYQCEAYGATADQCLVALGLTHQNGSARVSTLAKKGQIVRTAMKRKTRSGSKAGVYVHPAWLPVED